MKRFSHFVNNQLLNSQRTQKIYGNCLLWFGSPRFFYVHVSKCVWCAVYKVMQTMEDSLNERRQCICMDFWVISLISVELWLTDALSIWEKRFQMVICKAGLMQRPITVKRLTLCPKQTRCNKNSATSYLSFHAACESAVWWHTVTAN